jgi:hypothetical protein
MSSAERVIAWNEVLTAAGLDPHAVPDDVKRVIHAAVMRYAKASGLQPVTAPQRVASGERSAVAGDGVTVFPPFGRSKGQPIRGAAIDTLRFYERCARENLDNPDKAKWHHKEQALLDAVRDELRRQGEAANHE